VESSDGAVFVRSSELCAYVVNKSNIQSKTPSIVTHMLSGNTYFYVAHYCYRKQKDIKTRDSGLYKAQLNCIASLLSAGM
jgi:hypothetical protein